jgi:transcriptional regulator NrdR family protein
LTTSPKPTSTKVLNIVKLLLILGLSALIVAEGYFGYRLHQLSERQEQLKYDHAQMNNIMLGLFSIEQWQGKIETIITHQVKNLDITPKQKRELQKEIEGIILALINKAEALVTKPEKKSLRGKIVKFAVKNFVEVDTIKKQAPKIARTIIQKVDNPGTRKQLGAMALYKLDKIDETAFIDSTLKANARKVNKVYSSYQVDNRGDFNKKIVTELKQIETSTYRYSGAMLIGIIVILTAWWIFRKQKAYHSFFSICFYLIGGRFNGVDDRGRCPHQRSQFYPARSAHYLYRSGFIFSK